MTNGIPFKILLVDDDEDDRAFIDEAFMELQYQPEVKKFHNGKKLLEYLDLIEPSLYPSLIVLDNTLPELDATDILTLLKSNTHLKKIPVVIYTTTISPTKREQLMQLGAYDCIKKGDTHQEILSIAKKLKEIAERIVDSDK